MSKGRKLRLTLAFAMLAAVAVWVGCNGFFQDPVLTAIAIQPPSPSVQVGQTETLEAWGTYNDTSGNNRKLITSGVAWTSSNPANVSVNETTGVITGQGTGGTATITAAAQGLSTTATATAFLGNVSSYQVCMGTFGSTTSCSSGSSPLSWNVDVTSNTVQQNFVAQGVVTVSGNNQTLDLSTTSTWTIVAQPSSGTIVCTNSSSPAVCSVTQGATAGTYTITVTYGTSNTATINVTVVG